MITVRDHLARILAHVTPLPPVEVPVLDALGCVLAAEVPVLVSLPGFDNSAMDGYAVRAADGAGASPEAPVVLPVEADIPAGDRAYRTLTAGHAARIMTGAPVPEGADTIVPVEESDGATTQVALTAVGPVGRHIRRRGEDVHEGEVALRPGVRLGARDLALAAAVGHGALRVHPRPRVVVVSTGNELVAPGIVPGHGEVVDSNSTMLVAALREHDIEARLVGGVGDDDDTVLGVLGEAAADADAVVTTGGVSMGACDAVKSALSRLGTVRFDKVAMQPGKPQGFGTLGRGGTPIFTLPGNPVSALVSLEVFVLPALRVLAGRPAHETRLVEAVVEEGWSSPPGKAQFSRVVLVRRRTHHAVRLAGGPGSHLLGGLAEANALAIVGSDTTRVLAGQELRCLPIGPVRSEAEAAAAAAGKATAGAGGPPGEGSG